MDWTTSKTGLGFQKRSASSERMKDSNGGNWRGHRPWSLSDSNLQNASKQVIKTKRVGNRMYCMRMRQTSD